MPALRIIGDCRNKYAIMLVAVVHAANLWPHFLLITPGENYVMVDVIVQREIDYHRRSVTFRKTADQGEIDAAVQRAINHARDSGYGTITIRVKDRAVLELSVETSSIPES